MQLNTQSAHLVLNAAITQEWCPIRYPGPRGQPGELLTLAMAGAMTDPGGVLLTLPYLADDPQVRTLLANPPR